MRSFIRRAARHLTDGGLVLAGGVAIAAATAFTSPAKSAEPAATKVTLAPATTSAPGALPNGATALSETYNDWQVVCAVQAATHRCVAKQEQVNQQNHQLVLAVELTPGDDKVEGVAVLPFGLALESGVTLQIDEQPAAAPVHFKTCVPGGCLVALSFDSHTVSVLRTGTALKAKIVIDGGSDATLTISLKGLSAALDRTAALVVDRLASAKK